MKAADLASPAQEAHGLQAQSNTICTTIKRYVQEPQEFQGS